MQLAVNGAEAEANAARQSRQEERHEQSAAALQAAGERVTNLQVDVETLRSGEASLQAKVRDVVASCAEARRAEKVLDVKLRRMQGELQRANVLSESGLDRSNIDGLMQANLLVAEQLESFMRRSTLADQPGSGAGWAGGLGDASRSSHAE